MDPQIKSEFDQVERAVAKVESRQPRFQANARRAFFDLFGSSLSYISDEIPPYLPASRTRDEWLIKFAKTEPHLIGALQQAVSIDVNRGWELIGGRNQVNRFKQVLQNYTGAPGLYGWRNGIGITANSFYNTDINAIIELGREGEGGPVRALYHVDPTRCQLTGDLETPLKYFNGRKYDFWVEDDYIRVSSLPDVREKYNGLGFCAVSRCLELAVTLWAVSQYDQEQLAARAPLGLLLLTGYSEQNWIDAMEARDDDLTSRERQFFGGVVTLATTQTDGVDAKLVALSQLPKGLERKDFVDMTMYGYALAFGYDPQEFWPVQFGSLGRGEEASIQSEKATGKGGLSFALGFQDQIQQVLPDTILFQFQERDDRGQLIATEVEQAKADFIATLAKMRETTFPVFSNDQIIQLAIDQGIVPPEWSLQEEPATANDEGEVRKNEIYRERLLTYPEVMNAVRTLPDEEIVVYRWTPNGETMTTIFQSGFEAVKRQSFPVGKVKRQDEILYESPDGEVIITESDVDRAIREGAERDPILGELLTAEVING